MGEVPAPGWLETDAVLRVFSDERNTAVTGYRRFVAEGIRVASPWQGLKGQIYLGSDQFAERMQAWIPPAGGSKTATPSSGQAAGRLCRSLAGPRSRDG